MTRATPLLLALFLAACGSPERTEEVVSSWPDGTPKEVRMTEVGVNGVDLLQYHANGRLHVRGRMLDGAREGTWNTYRENGQPWSQVEYRAGVKEGLFRTWHPDGMPHIEGQHESDLPAGEWTFFSTDGSVVETRDMGAAN